MDNYQTETVAAGKILAALKFVNENQNNIWIKDVDFDHLHQVLGYSEIGFSAGRHYKGEAFIINHEYRSYKSIAEKVIRKFSTQIECYKKLNNDRVVRHPETQNFLRLSKVAHEIIDKSIHHDISYRIANRRSS